MFHMTVMSSICSVIKSLNSKALVDRDLLLRTPHLRIFELIRAAVSSERLFCGAHGRYFRKWNMVPFSNIMFSLPMQAVMTGCSTD